MTSSPNLPITVLELLLRTCSDYPGSQAYASLDENGEWRPISWETFASQTRDVAQGLARMGLRKGDCFGILAPTSLEWELAHLGALSLGAVVVGLDVNDPPDRLQHIADNAGLTAVLVDKAAYLERLTPDQVRTLKFAVTLESCGSIEPIEIAPWHDVRAPQTSFPRAPTIVLGSDPATLIYTSGTTGAPKGILYSHAQLMLATTTIAHAYSAVPPGSRFLCWLPLSNLFQRVTNLASMSIGGCSYLLGDPRKVMDVVQAVEPTVFIGVPRFYELLANGIESNIAGRLFLLRWTIRLAIFVGGLRAIRQRADRPVPTWLCLVHGLSEHLVLCKLRGIMGSRIQFLVSGSAPFAPWLLEYFHALGLLVLESYGLSENIVPMAMNTPDSYRFGSVGRVLPENDVWLKAPAGDISVRGPGLFHGYHRDPASAGIMADGAYDTGDFGFIDGDGFLTLKGRRSDLIKTSTGRRIAPARVEAALKRNRYVDQVIVLGQGRPYLIALLTIDWKAALTLTDAEAGNNEPPPVVIAEIRREIERAVSDLSRYEHPGAFLIFRHRFSVETGEVTSNLKLRRSAIAKRYEKLVDQIYGRQATDSAPIYFISEAQLQKERFADVQRLDAIQVSAVARCATLAKMALLVARLGLQNRFFALDLGEATRMRREEIATEQIAKILGTHLGPLKGPMVKVGQMASYIAEGLPQSIRVELSRLLTATPPLSGAVIRSIVERELGKPIAELMREWDDVPISAASMGQVHLARLHDGRQVTVKVRYPDIDKITASDLTTLKLILPFLGWILKVSNYGELYDEIRSLFIAECDFLQEARNQKLFRRLLSDNPDIIIPEVYDEYTTMQVLTMDYIEGQSYGDFKATATQAEKNRAASIMGRLSLESTCRFGIFNADPNPGNYLFVGGKVCFVDFGCVKRWTSTRFIDLWKEQSLAGAANDLERFTSATKELGFISESGTFDYKALMDDYRAGAYMTWMDDRPYRFDNNYMKHHLGKLFKHDPRAGVVRIPPEFIAISRFYAGLYAIFCDLEVDINWRDQTMQILNERTPAFEALQ